MKKTVIAALLGATLLTGGAMAAVQNQTQPQDAPRHRMMRDPMLMADANQDGIVTRDETIAAVNARFAKLDGNKDGKITREERQAARETMRERFGGRMRGGQDSPRGPEGGPRGPGIGHGPDGNGDGIVTLDEQRARALKVFDFVDRNGDGRVDQAERDLVHEVMMAMGGPGGPHGRHGPHPGGDDMPPPPPPPAPRPNGG